MNEANWTEMKMCKSSWLFSFTEQKLVTKHDKQQQQNTGIIRVLKHIYQ